MISGVSTYDNLVIDHYVSVTQKFFDEEDTFIVGMETVNQISLLNQLSFILEHFERVYEEVTNDPFDSNRANFMIQELLDNTREDLVENIFNHILMNTQVDDDLLIAGMRFLIATSSLLDPSTYMNEELLDRLMDTIHKNSEYNKDTKKINEGMKITLQGLSKRVLCTGLLSLATADDDVSSYVVTHNMAAPLLYRLRYYIGHRVKRPKYMSYEAPRDEEQKKKKKKKKAKEETSAEDESKSTNEASSSNTDGSTPGSNVPKVDDIMSNGSAEPERGEVNSDDLNEEQLKYMELRMVLRVFQGLGDYLEVLGPFIQEGGMDLVNPLLTIKDKFILTESLKFCSVMLTHQRFVDLFVNNGGLKQILKLPKIPYLVGGVGLCIRDIGSSAVMDRLCKIGPYMEKMVEHGLMLLESSVNELKKIGSIFFYSAFSYRPIVNLFDKANGLKALVNIFRMPISFPEDTVSGKNLAHCACLALRSYFRTHLLLSGFQMNQKRTKKKGKLKYLDVHKIAGNHVIMDIFAKHINTLASYLQRQSWRPASDLMSYGGITILIELINVASYWRTSHVAHCALEVLQLVTMAPFTHLPFCEETPDSSRNGLAILLGIVATKSPQDIFIITAALDVIVNIVCLPEPPAVVPPSISQAKRRICELLRTNDGLGILLDILRSAGPLNTDIVRALSCKALLGLSQDATINQILRKMDVSEVVSDLLKQSKEKENLEDFKKFQHYAIELLSKTTGREPKTISMEARDHTLVRLEKAAIVANTSISFQEKELMQIIHEYLKNKGMTKTASQLIDEAHIEPLERDKPNVPPLPESSKMERIVTNFLRHQHRECEEPISVLPPLSLLSTHKCPIPQRYEDASMNVVTRMLTKKLHPTTNRTLHSYNMRKMDREFLYNRLRHWTTFMEEKESINCAAFDRYGQTLFCGTEFGELHHYDIESKETLGSFQIGDIVEGLRFSKDCSNLLAWVGDSTRLYHSDYSNPLYEFKESACAEWSNGNDLIVGTGVKATYIYDALRGDKIADLIDPKLEKEWGFNIACFNPYDDLILSDAVLWDYRIPHTIVHRFDRLSTQGLGIFHPNGYEVIINSEIWDVRTFRLLSTCPALAQTKSIVFSPNNDILYAIYRQSLDNTYVRSNSFRAIDSRTMDTISTIDSEGNIVGIAADPTNSYVACIGEDKAESHYVCKLFEIGRARKGEEDESDGEEEEREEEEEEELELEDESFDEDEIDMLDLVDGVDGMEADIDFEVDGDLLAALLNNTVADDDDDDDDYEEEDLF